MMSAGLREWSVVWGDRVAWLGCKYDQKPASGDTAVTSMDGSHCCFIRRMSRANSVPDSHFQLPRRMTATEQLTDQMQRALDVEFYALGELLRGNPAWPRQACRCPAGRQ